MRSFLDASQGLWGKRERTLRLIRLGYEAILSPVGDTRRIPALNGLGG